jgi:AraC family transcriptional activator of pobA
MSNQSRYYAPFLDATIPNTTPFNVYEIKSRTQIIRTCKQRGFYKICLVTGNNLMHSDNRRIVIVGTNLFFGNAYTTFNREFIAEEQSGYACTLTKDFLKRFDYSNLLQRSRLFDCKETLVFSLNDEQTIFITSIFEKIISEQSTAYIFKDELIHNWIIIIMHEALKMRIANRF